MMRLLTAHRLLVACALALSLVLAIWGARHRDLPSGGWVLALALVAMPLLGLYLRKLYRNPPIR
jgi:hypothetical protein